MDLTLAIVLIGLLVGLSLFLAIRLSSLNRKNKTVTSNLTAANARNENALWLCYLLQGVLQVCITVLHEEQRRFDRLQKTYDDFAARVSEATDQQRVRRSVTAVLGLIPGANLIGVLGDVLDVFGEAIDVADVVEAASDTPGLKGLEAEDDDLTLLFVSVEAARSLLGISGEQQVLKDIETLDPDTLKNFMDEAIKRVAESMRPLTVPERKKVITRIAAKFGEFGLEYERSEETDILPQTGNTSGSD